MSWQQWRGFFESRANAPSVSSVEAPPLEPSQKKWLLRSLRIFQIGETGEGRITREIELLQCLDVDADYRASLRLIIAEEGRHARALALCCRALGGAPLERNWAAQFFTLGRRAAGVRMKLIVLFAAEVIGIVFYMALAAALPPGQLAAQLGAIGQDEVAHYDFHHDFFRQYRGWNRFVFLVIWWGVGLTCLTVLVADHRKTFRAFGISLLHIITKSLDLIACATSIQSSAGLLNPSHLRSSRAA